MRKCNTFELYYHTLLELHDLWFHKESYFKNVINDLLSNWNGSYIISTLEILERFTTYKFSNLYTNEKKKKHFKNKNKPYSALSKKKHTHTYKYWSAILPLLLELYYFLCIQTYSFHEYRKYTCAHILVNMAQQFLFFHFWHEKFYTDLYGQNETFAVLRVMGGFLIKGQLRMKRYFAFSLSLSDDMGNKFFFLLLFLEA